jgi:hypothetical protein
LFLNLLVLLLTSCASQPETVFAPVAVDMPVPLACHAPDIAPPQDVMSALPANATLTAFTKACAEQTLLDRGTIAQLQAAVKACRE